MDLHGLQKLTLLDFPGHTACTVFLGGCDLRCPFCHNFELVENPGAPIVSEEEFFSFLNKRTGLLDGVAITGGEPCLRSNLKDFIERIRTLGFLIKLDTNGFHPDVLASLLEQNLLDYVAVDIKNSPEKYAHTTGLDAIDLAPLYNSIDLLLHASIDYEFRTTAIAQFHEADDFRAIGEMIAGAKHYFLQPFTDRDTVPFAGLSAPDAETLKQYIGVIKEYVPNSSIRGE